MKLIPSWTILKSQLQVDFFKNKKSSLPSSPMFNLYWTSEVPLYLVLEVNIEHYGFSENVISEDTKSNNKKKTESVSYIKFRNLSWFFKKGCQTLNSEKIFVILNKWQNIMYLDYVNTQKSVRKRIKEENGKTWTCNFIDRKGKWLTNTWQDIQPLWKREMQI